MKNYIFKTISQRIYPEILGEGNDSPESVMKFLELSKKEALRLVPQSVKQNRSSTKELPEEVRNRLIEIGTVCELVADYFGGNLQKTALWFKINNPALGNISPRDMIRIGRYKVLIDFINDSLTGNYP